MIKRLCIVICVLTLILFTSCETPSAFETEQTTESNQIQQTTKTTEFEESENIEQTTESEHFVIYYSEKDADLVDYIIDGLENNYERITSILQVELSEKSEIYVYYDFETFHKDVVKPNWTTGVYYDGQIRILVWDEQGVPFDYEDMGKVAVHEFVHLAAASVNKNAPAYLNEGLATFLAEQDEWAKETAIFAIQNNHFPSVEQLYRMSADEGLYTYGYLYVKYIVYEYGYEYLLELYKRPPVYSSDEFQENWINYLIDAYSIELSE